MSATQSQHQQGRSDAQQGKGPKNTSNMPHQSANAYDAGYHKGK